MRGGILMHNKTNPIQFADIHNHMLFGVDDGAQNEADMDRLIDASYQDGVRTLCFTPHYHPGYFGEHQDRIASAFELAKQYASQHYPDLELFLGSELRYERSCLEWIQQGRCQSLNNTDYLLVDFLYHEPADRIIRAMLHILNAGYIPVLAHAERYEAFHRDLNEIQQLHSWGGIIQLDSQSIMGGLGLGAKRRSKQILKMELADLIASDAHDLKKRPPQLRDCYELIVAHWNSKYADLLFSGNPLRILHGERIR